MADKYHLIRKGFWQANTTGGDYGIMAGQYSWRGLWDYGGPKVVEEKGRLVSGYQWIRRGLWHVNIFVWHGWPVSSVGQSMVLVVPRSSVRVRYAPLDFSRHSFSHGTGKLTSHMLLLTNCCAHTILSTLSSPQSLCTYHSNESAVHIRFDDPLISPVAVHIPIRDTFISQIAVHISF